MSKPISRWPTWKIAVWTAGCAVACPALFWLALFADQKLEKPTSPAGPGSVLTIPSLVMMVAALAGLLAVMGAAWLVVRIRDARTPTWQKRGHKKRF